MNVIVCSLYGIYTPHLETDMELVLRHLDAGDTVRILECRQELLACDINPAHDPATCFSCTRKRSAGLSALHGRFDRKPLLKLTPANKQELRDFHPAFASMDDLKSLRVENFDIGYAVLSSLVSQIREPNPDVKKHSDLIHRLMASALAVFRSMQNHLGEEPCDRVYLYNGRYAPLRAVVRACESRNVIFCTHERGSSLDRYSLFENKLPHDREHAEQLIRQAWKDAEGNPDREQIASQFYEKRAQGMGGAWHSFVKDQDKDLLPPNWDASRRNIVIFSSSEDEFVAIGDSWTNPLYKNQLDAMRRMVGSISSLHPGYHLYLRLHPNLKAAPYESFAPLLHLQDPRLTIIRPEDKISSYALLRNADKILSFGSTMGIEATYWGIPSILAGASIYRNLGGTCNPQTHEELMALLNADLQPCNREAALIYGYYMNTFGVPYLHFKPTGILEGEFRGRQLEPGRLADLLQALMSRLPRVRSLCARSAQKSALRRMTRP